MKNRLPKYWVVKCDGSDKFLGSVKVYIERLYGKYWNFNTESYYGYGGRGYKGTECHSGVSMFDNNPTVLTIDEFIVLTTETPIIEIY